MNLSAHFTLKELTRTQVRADNTAPPEVIEKLKLLCEKVLEPVRAKFGPVLVSSGYRSLAVNRAVGSEDTSQHRRGEASDFESPPHSNYAIAAWIRDNLDFDQCILEEETGTFRPASDLRTQERQRT